MINNMVCVRSMAETLEHQPTWAMIVFQSKVRLGVSLGEHDNAAIINAPVSQDRRVSCRFHMVI